LKGFTASSWPVRNSTLMCYTSLIQRAIGTKRTKSDHATQNTTTSREFFARFPHLKESLLEQLKNAIQNSQSTELHPNLYPCLLLFSRLRSSTAIGNDQVPDAGDVSAFIPLVTRCASLRHYLIRSMAARALIPLISSGDMYQFVLSLFNTVSDVVVGGNENEVHGILLQILQFSTIIDELVDHQIAYDWFIRFCSTIEETGLLTSGPEYNYVSRTVVFEILSVLLEKIKTNQLHHDTLLKLIKYADKYIDQQVQSNEFEGVGFVELQAEATGFALNAYTYILRTTDVVGELLKLVEKCMDHNNQKIRIRTFQYVTRLTDEQPQNTLFTINDRHIFGHLLQHVLYREPRVAVNCIRFGLECLQKLSIHYAELGQFKQQYVKDEVVERIISLHTENRNCYIREQSLVLLGSFIPYISNKKHFAVWTELVEESSNTFQPDNVRSGCQKSIQHSKVLYNDNIESSEDLFRVWTTCVRLLQDDEDDIRQATTVMVSPTKKQQVDAALQDSFTYMSSKFVNCEFYSLFLLDLVALEESDEDGSIQIPFAEELSDNPPALFDKEEDNLFQEELFAIQLSAFYLHKLNLSDELRNQYLQKLLKQLNYIVKLIEKPDALFWIGDVSYHPMVFQTLYRLVIGLLALSQQQLQQQEYSNIFQKYSNPLLHQLKSIDENDTSLFFMLRVSDQQ
jgi:hypothetical protein